MFQTSRLILRRWQDEDRVHFAKMNADPCVMRYFPSVLAEAESNNLIDKIEAGFEKHGYGLWCAHHIEADRCIGFVGLAYQDDDLSFMPCTEIGWRLDADFHRQGLAFEAAEVVRDAAFEQYGLDEIVSMTARLNIPSQGLMDKIGMTRDPQDDFQHIRLPTDHELSWHVLYRLAR